MHHIIYPIQLVDDDGNPRNAESLAYAAAHRVNLIIEHLSRPDAELQEPTHQTYARIVQLQAQVAELQEKLR